MNLDALAEGLKALGCPPDKCREMAAQLDKRATQLSQIKGTTYESAMKHLLSLMQKGWSAQARGL